MLEKNEVFSKEKINEMLSNDPVLYRIYEQMKDYYNEYYTAHRYYKHLCRDKYTFLLNQFLIQCSFHIFGYRFLYLIELDGRSPKSPYDYIAIIKIKHENTEVRVGYNFFDYCRDGEVLESFVYTLDEFLGRFFNLIMDVHSKHVLKPSFLKVLSVLNDNL